MKRIGQRIATVRKEANLTQQDLADRLGVTYQAVSNWERGQSMPDLFRLKDLAALFRLSLDDFLSREELTTAKVATGETAPENADQLKEAAPFMAPQNLDESLNKTPDLSLEDLADLAPFLSDQVIYEVARIF